MKDFARVTTGEMAGFRDRIEVLRKSGAVDGEIVDRFVKMSRSAVRAVDVVGLGKHIEDGACVRCCKGFVLLGVTRG